MSAEPQCHSCKHYEGGVRCKAFGNKDIPDEIIMQGTHDHREPFEGDNGITWEENTEIESFEEFLKRSK